MSDSCHESSILYLQALPVDWDHVSVLTQPWDSALQKTLDPGVQHPAR